jgi:hypothetical protein
MKISELQIKNYCYNPTCNHTSSLDNLTHYLSSLYRLQILPELPVQNWIHTREPIEWFLHISNHYYFRGLKSIASFRLVIRLYLFRGLSASFLPHLNIPLHHVEGSQAQINGTTASILWVQFTLFDLLQTQLLKSIQSDFLILREISGSLANFQLEQLPCLASPCFRTLS